MIEDPWLLDLPLDPVPRSYRIGVAGAGGIVTQSHLPAYRDSGFQVVRIASRSRSSADEVASEFGIPEFSDRFEDLVEDPDIEVVDISLPPHVQPNLCEAAFRAGKHVMVQKPMATTLDAARAIVHGAADAGVKAAANQNGRWDPAIRACKALVEGGEFGALVTASIELRTRQPWQAFWENAELYPRLMILGMSIHHLDQFRFLFGDPEGVTAVTQRYPGQPWAGDSIASYALHYGPEFKAYAFDDGFPWIRDWSVRYRIEGTEAIALGEIGWPTAGHSTLRFTRRTAPDTWYEPFLSRRWFPDAFSGTMGELFNAINEDREPSIGVADNLKTLALVEAAYQSAAEGRFVALAEVLDA